VGLCVLFPVDTVLVCACAMVTGRDGGGSGDSAGSDYGGSGYVTVATTVTVVTVVAVQW
jgi:hypothetical protein